MPARIGCGGSPICSALPEPGCQRRGSTGILAALFNVPRGSRFGERFLVHLRAGLGAAGALHRPVQRPDVGEDRRPAGAQPASRGAEVRPSFHSGRWLAPVPRRPDGARSGGRPPGTDRTRGSLMRFRWLAAFPLLYAAVFIAISWSLGGGEALAAFAGGQKILVRLLAIVGCFLAVSAFERGDHLRTAWLWLGAGSVLILLRDLLRFLPPFQPAAAGPAAQTLVSGLGILS